MASCRPPTSRRNAERQQALITALRRRFGDRVRIEGAAAGLHVVAWFDDLPLKHEEALIKAARAKGVGIYPVSALVAGRRNARKTVGLVMGYSALEVAQIERGCRLLAQAVAELD
ncbi:hypothetical protein QY049_06770 [Bradyrhizobium sp. WYCCWR 13022]|uniref:hypothetical protein n=1 Tax=Bradyrhizobium TaxID=374 RepID=UPI002162571C|nr:MULTISPECIES: hypothetical protein [Bradyrhizobium]MDN4982932.1 hypothetical protein [Bradyrhizobium sp. WYCCWR 13022]